MMEFCVGDKVKVIRYKEGGGYINDIGVVKKVDLMLKRYAVEFNNSREAYSTCDGLTAYGRGAWCDEGTLSTAKRKLWGRK